MPITIDGTGSITGLSAGGLPDASVTLADLASSVASGVAKAWVNFNGTGTVAIRAQFNVSSITDNGVGDYTINFLSALQDASYTVSGITGGNGASATTRNVVIKGADTTGATNKTASALTVQAGATATAALVDVAEIDVLIIR